MKTLFYSKEPNNSKETENVCIESEKHDMCFQSDKKIVLKSF